MGEVNDLQEGLGESQDKNLNIRKALNDAYAFVEGSKSVQSFSAFTVEEAHDQFIERVEGKGTTLRPNLLGRIDRVLERVRAVVTEVKAQPPEAFRVPDPESNVNT